MNDFLLVEIIVGLFAVILGEFLFFNSMLERIQKEKDKLLEEMARSNRALVAKNAHEYVMTASIDKVMTDEKAPQQPEDEGMEETALSDKDWFKAMGIEKEPDGN